jgi:hypothetical protein
VLTPVVKAACVDDVGGLVHVDMLARNKSGIPTEIGADGQVI